MTDEVRLIDANALKDSLKELKAKGYNQKYVQGLQDAIDGYFPQIIDDAPTAEAEPVKHAHWSINPDGYYPQCSNCGYEPPRELIRRNALSLEPILTKYCPNCGSENGTKIYRGR